MADLTSHLLVCGANITQLNTVRRHLSRVKGGRLGAATNAPYATLALSDVVGSEPSAIASGPTVSCTSDSSDAMAILDQHGRCIAISDSILRALAQPPATPPPDMPFVVIGDGEQAARAAAAAHPGASVISHSLIGEAREAAVVAIEATPLDSIGVFAGETVVTVTGKGLGGRNQEAALAAAIAIDGLDITFLAIGTDGVDGPTNAAGAIVDGTTAGIARDHGLELQAALDDNDAHRALTQIGSTIVTGSTGTNTGDLWIIAKGSPGSDSQPRS
jgi:hydroxypyruvate reductase